MQLPPANDAWWNITASYIQENIYAKALKMDIVMQIII